MTSGATPGGLSHLDVQSLWYTQVALLYHRAIEDANGEKVRPLGSLETLRVYANGLNDAEAGSYGVFFRMMGK